MPLLLLRADPRRHQLHGEQAHQGVQPHHLAGGLHRGGAGHGAVRGMIQIWTICNIPICAVYYSDLNIY